MSYTYATLLVSARTYNEVIRLLKKADYSHAIKLRPIKQGHDPIIIDMNGLALTKRLRKKPKHVAKRRPERLFGENVRRTWRTLKKLK